MKKALLAALLFVGALFVPLRPAAATDTELMCSQTSVYEPTEGLGSPEQAELNQDLYIPFHETACPGTVGKLAFTATSEAYAISALQNRQIPGRVPIKPSFFIGVDQPLASYDWATATSSLSKPAEQATPVYHLPLLMDAFVVTANIPCSNPSNQPLKLTPLTLSLIYSGAVTRWGDQALRAPDNNNDINKTPGDNAWLEGCGSPIVVAARQGAVWSNAVLKDYMAKRNPLFAPYKERDRLAIWPPTLHVACSAPTEADMAGCALLSGSISYMRYATAQANGLTPVLLANGNDQTPPPALSTTDTWPSGCTSAVAVGDLTVPQLATPLGMATDFSNFSLTYGKNGYAMCAFSYVVSLANGPGGTELKHIVPWRDHLRIMWFDSPQESLKSYGYAPVPPALVSLIRNTQPLTG
jgi:ABC-type phosphate transport system substrate-binding protein